MIKAIQHGIAQTIWYAFLAAIILILFIVIIVFINSCHYRLLHEFEESRVQKNIYSASLSTSQIKGRFFLGSGYISSESYYFFYTDTGKGLHLEKIKADESYIFQDVEKISDSYLLTINTKQYWEQGWIWKNKRGPDLISIRYEIHVPKETIVQEMKLNLSDVR